MQGLDSKILEAMVLEGCRVRFQAHGGTMKMTATLTDKYGESIVTGVGGNKPHALEDCNRKWLELKKPNSQPTSKKKTSKKKSAHKTAPIEEDAQDA